jgi:predicted component of type VI protein secretion system
VLDILLQITHERANIKQLKLGSLTTIGRGAECNLKIASSEISRKHCQLTVDDERVLVRDLGSSNGTYVNGKLIPPNQDIELSPGSRFTIGPVKCVVQFTSPKPADPATSAAASPGETLILTPDSTARTNASDFDFAIMQSDAGAQVAAEIAAASNKKPDTELDMYLANDAAHAARGAIDNAGDPPPDLNLHAKLDAPAPTDEPTQFLFGPDDTVPPGTLHAPAAEQPSFGDSNESDVPALTLPIEPIATPATKRRKGFFDLFKRNAKLNIAPAESSPAPSTPSADSASPSSASTEPKSSEPVMAQPSTAAPTPPGPLPATTPQPSVVPTTPATSDDIEPFWN